MAMVWLNSSVLRLSLRSNRFNIDQVPSIQDATKEDLQEIASTGTLKSGEKVLADLRKRKLIVQR